MNFKLFSGMSLGLLVKRVTKATAKFVTFVRMYILIYE